MKLFVCEKKTIRVCVQSGKEKFVSDNCAFEMKSHLWIFSFNSQCTVFQLINYKVRCTYTRNSRTAGIELKLSHRFNNKRVQRTRTTTLSNVMLFAILRLHLKFDSLAYRVFKKWTGTGTYLFFLFFPGLFNSSSISIRTFGRLLWGFAFPLRANTAPCTASSTISRRERLRPPISWTCSRNATPGRTWVFSCPETDSGPGASPQWDRCPTFYLNIEGKRFINIFMYE